MPVLVQRRPAVATAPLGQQRVLVVPEDDLFRVRGRRRFGGDVLGPRRVQRLNGQSQQLTVAHRHQLPGLRRHGDRGFVLRPTRNVHAERLQTCNAPYQPGWRASSPVRWPTDPWRPWTAAQRSN